MNRNKRITLSDSSFYQKIVGKYTLGRNISFHFPIMFLLKNKAADLFIKMNLDILVQLDFHNKSVISSQLYNKTQRLRRLFSRFKTEIRIPQFILKPTILKNIPMIPDIQQSISGLRVPIISKLMSRLSGIQPGSEIHFLPKMEKSWVHYSEYKHISYAVQYPSYGTENIRKVHSVLLHTSPVTLSQVHSLLNDNPSYNTAFQQQAVHDNYSKERTIMPSGQINYLPVSPEIVQIQRNSQLGNAGQQPFTKVNIKGQGSAFRLNAIPVLPKTNFLAKIKTLHNVAYYQKADNFVNGPGISGHGLQYKSPYIISKVNYIPDNKPGKGKDQFNVLNQNLPTSIKSVIRQDHDNDRYSNNIFKPYQKRYALNENKNLYFTNHRKIEQAIEVVKKIAEEAKDTVTKTIPESGDEIMYNQINIHHISEQVYQLIDRKLKIEKERRGYW